MLLNNFALFHFFSSGKHGFVIIYLFWRIKVIMDRKTSETLQAQLKYNSVEIYKE